MLTSTYFHSIDAKLRVFIPAKFREELGEEIVIARGRHDFLTVYSAPGWLRYVKRKTENLNDDDKEIYMRYLNGTSLSVTLDTTGRVQMTKDLVDYMNPNSSKVIFVGCGDYCEIWSEQGYNDHVASITGEEIRELLKKNNR